MQSRVAEILSPAERIHLMKVGAYMKCAELGLTADKLDTMFSVKQAFGLGDVGKGVEGIAKTIVAVSVLAGVPIGIAAHAVGRSINADTAKEKELKTEAGYYRNAANQLERSLTGNPTAT